MRFPSFPQAREQTLRTQVPSASLGSRALCGRWALFRAAPALTKQKGFTNINGKTMVNNGESMDNIWIIDDISG